MDSLLFCFSQGQKMIWLAYQADIAGRSEEEIARLKSHFAGFSPYVDIFSSTDASKTAQLIVAEINDAFVKDLEELYPIDNAIDSPWYVEVYVVLRELYVISDYLKPLFIVNVVLELFSQTNVYHEDLKNILAGVTTLKQDLTSCNGDGELVPAQGRVRGKIMMLLNTLPQLFLTNTDEIATWKTEFIADLYSPYKLPPPATPYTFGTGSTVAMEWERFKPSSESVLLSLDLGGLDAEKVKPISPTPKEDGGKGGDDVKGTKSNIPTSKDQSSELGALFTAIYDDFPCETFAKEFKRCVDPEVLTPSFANTISDMMSKPLPKTCRFDTMDDVFDHIIKSTEAIYKVCKLDKTAKIDEESPLYLGVYEKLVIHCRNQVFAKIKSMGPMAKVATLDFHPCVIKQLLLTDFKKEKPYRVNVPMGVITAKGSGKLEVIDDQGHPCTMVAILAPGSNTTSYVAHGHRPFKSQIKMLKKFPAIVPIKQIERSGYRVGKSCGFYNTYTHESKGNIYVMSNENDLLMPLRQLLTLADLIKTWSALKFHLEDMLHQMKHLEKGHP